MKPQSVNLFSLKTVFSNGLDLTPYDRPISVNVDEHGDELWKRESDITLSMERRTRLELSETRDTVGSVTSDQFPAAVSGHFCDWHAFQLLHYL